MSYSFQGISTMSSALRAYQAELNTTGDNIANSETAGYHRRTATLQQAPSTSVTLGATVTVGNGVSVSSVSRVRDMFLAGARSSAESKLGRQQTALAGAGGVQSAMMEPSDGISAAYDAFNSSWTALAASPGDATVKADVQQAGRTLAMKFNAVGRGLEAQKADNATSTKEILGKIDAATAKIASLNTDIARASAEGGTPNDLLDQRDQAVQDLAGLADITATGGNGNVTISLNGLPLVTPSGATTISDKYNATTGRIVEGASSFAVNGGSLAGTFDTAQTIASTSAKLDAFADTLRSGVNALYTTGKLADGTTGGAFFAEPTAPSTTTGALDLRLSDAVAADPRAIASGTSGLSGDGTLAAQIADLATAKVAGLGNQSLSTYYAGVVSGVGQGVSTLQASVDTQNAVVTQIDAQVSSTSGVSMDDEMANMLRFQRAYQAAAKALTTFDSMMGTVIDMLNR